MQLSLANKYILLFLLLILFNEAAKPKQTAKNSKKLSTLQSTTTPKTTTQVSTLQTDYYSPPISFKQEPNDYFIIDATPVFNRRKQQSILFDCLVERNQNQPSSDVKIKWIKDDKLLDNEINNDFKRYLMILYLYNYIFYLYLTIDKIQVKYIQMVH
jgi:hypothetical protein